MGVWEGGGKQGEGKVKVKWVERRNQAEDEPAWRRGGAKI